MSVPRWWPTPGAWLWVVLFLGIQFAPRRAGLLSDGDPCWHWLQGNWMLEHRAVLRADFLSHTRPGAPLVCKDWGSDVLWAVAGNLGGWSGILLLAAALIATTLGLFCWQLRSDGIAPVVAVGATLLALGACAAHWLARPHLWTQLLIVPVAWTMREFNRDRLTARQAAWRLALVLAVWANLHGGFLMGLVVIALYAAGDAVERPRRLGPAAGLFVVGWVATLLNPNGWRLHAHVLEFLRQPALTLSTDEWRAPDLSSVAMRGFVVWLVAALGTLAVVWRRLRPSELVVVMGWVGLALLAARHVPLCALVVTPVLAAHFAGPKRAAAGGSRGGNAVLVAGAVAGAVGALVGGWQTELPARDWPVQAADFVRANGERLRGAMFNEYAWGGYLAQELPGRRVFVDGRNDFYGLPLLREYETVARALPGWEKVLAQYQVGWTILPPASPLNQALARAGWECAYADPVATIYRRKP